MLLLELGSECHPNEPQPLSEDASHPKGLRREPHPLSEDATHSEGLCSLVEAATGSNQSPPMMEANGYPSSVPSHHLSSPETAADADVVSHCGYDSHDSLSHATLMRATPSRLTGRARGSRGLHGPLRRRVPRTRMRREAKGII
ncbi:hypothetical protein CYMTET_53682 [Cymbomonas tetramitiformis]|uniref:Uncharacterized protein n=1 Tax=Cymbomonas tetramitiformis TaxID=36881 RepID=A0AAE0BHM6_9CHLO|nr:hypothetical protein CYMTET_53682 [Cymbomonas tetramitiformis]